MRTLLIAIALISCTLTSAQTANIVKEEIASCISVIPQEYSFNNKPAIVTTDYDEGSHSYNFRIFDTKLENETNSSFTPDILSVAGHREMGRCLNDGAHLASATCIFSPDTLMTRLSVEIKSESGETIVKNSNITVEEIQKFVLPKKYRNYLSNRLTASDEYYDYETFEWCDGFAFGSLIGVNKELFGNRLVCGYDYDYYPNFYTIINRSEAYIYYLNKLGEFYRIDLLKSKSYYTINGDKIYSIDLDQVDEQPNLYISQPQPINIISSGLTSSDCSLTFSQTLFNNDEAVEYIGYKYGNPKETVIEKDRDKDGYIDYRETTKNYQITGLTVRTTDGRNLYSFDFPAGYSLYDGSVFNLLDMQEYRHLIVHVKNEQNVKYMLVYRIDPAQATIQQVGKPMRARVAPTIVSRGSDISVQLPEGHGQTDISVTSLSGQTEMTDRMPMGGGRTTIDTGSLPRGMHIVTLTDNDNNARESTKVIVK